jgi:hypothetical protein
MGSSASPIVLVVVVLVLARFPVVRAKLPPLAFPSSLFLLSYVQPGNRPQSVIDHEDDYKDEED